MTIDPVDVMRLMQGSPFNRLLGIQGECRGPGHVVMTLPAADDVVGDPRRPALHGGVVASLVDTAGGAAAWSTLASGESVSTMNLSVDYLEPAGLGAPLRAEATLVRKGSRVCHVRVSVTQGDVHVADGRGLYSIHRPRAHRGPPTG